MTHEEFERIVKTIPTFSNRVKMKNYHRSLIQQIATLETINLALVQKRAELEEEIATDDVLLANSNRILKEFPCPVHGECVPYVIEKLRAGLKEER